MIDPIRFSDYIRSLAPERESLPDEIRREAQNADVPVIRPETEALLVFLLKMRKPLRILEIGAAVGYSAVVMAYACPEAFIDTIENYEKRIPVCLSNLKRAGVSDRVHLYEGDASEVLKTLTGLYDFIFMDAAKAQYIRWLPDCERLLKPGGILFTDNVLQEGDVLEARTVIERRDRTIHKRMREFLYEITHSEAWESVILPVGDGAAVSFKPSSSGFSTPRGRDVSQKLTEKQKMSAQPTDEG